MAEPATGRALRIVLRIMALVMIVAGSATVLLGMGSLLGAEHASAAIDSEMRFYAIWYVVAGVVLWRALPRIEAEKWLVRVIGIAFGVAGCARALSWLVVGEPHPSQVALMIIELVLPFVIIPWHSAVTRARHS